MPKNITQEVVDTCGMSSSEVENKWEKAKEVAAKGGHEKEYDYIMGIFKNMLGGDCIKKLGWNKGESYSNTKAGDLLRLTEEMDAQVDPYMEYPTDNKSELAISRLNKRFPKTSIDHLQYKDHDRLIIPGHSNFEAAQDALKDLEDVQVGKFKMDGNNVVIAKVPKYIKMQIPKHMKDDTAYQL